MKRYLRNWLIWWRQRPRYGDPTIYSPLPPWHPRREPSAMERELLARLDAVDRAADEARKRGPAALRAHEEKINAAYGAVLGWNPKREPLA